ncbi:CUB and zona pellucida-like domain-containing protein 1 [Symphorus nematophorus]
MVYDGSSTSSRLLGRVCGRSNATFHSTGYYLTVQFRTDGSVSYSGFRADYRVVDVCRPTSAPPPSPTAGDACGGSLFGSGTFSSPNHPNYYYDNAYCSWQLRAAYDQRIVLTFTYLQLENCCSCDYIKVFDGPSVSSRYLGTVCNDTLISFYSTSNYMTVLFRTDSSVVGRGFSANFMSSLSPSSGRVDCSSDNMNIVVERSYLNSLGYDGHTMYLNDPQCRPQITYYQVVFSFPINTCGNVQKFENGRVVYTNTLRAYTTNSGEITRQTHLKLNVACRMEQDSVAQIMYVVHHDNNSSITGTGRFNTSMDFYTSSSFYYKVTQVPYEVFLNQNLYVQVDLRRADSSLVLFLDTCVASPSPHDFHTRAYYLVRNGCPADDTYRAYVTGTRAYARFTFKAFKFLRATESVYIQCKVLICPASDNNSRCRRGCVRRAARDLGSKHDSQTLVLGPIKLKEPEKKEEGTKKEDKA